MGSEMCIRDRYYGHNGYCKGDSRKLWRTLSSIMGDTKRANNSSGHTTDEFAAFFAEKVDSVRQLLWVAIPTFSPVGNFRVSF